MRMLGPFYSSEVLPPFLVEQVFSLQSKSPPCRASLILAELVSSLQSKFSPCRASFLKLGGQVWAFVLSGAHTKDGLYLLWACGHGPVGLAKPYLTFYPLQLVIELTHEVGKLGNLHRLAYSYWFIATCLKSQHSQRIC